jgi:DNA-binding beta-propeller fold protein YncE
MPLRLAIVIALLGVALAITLSPARAWIGDRFDEEPRPATPAFAALPKGGSVLAISRSGAYAISPDGDTQGLGSFAQAGWSPHGLHVVGADGHRLTAVDPLGTIKWTRVRQGRVHHPAWSTRDGFVVAYLERTALRVVAGNGDPATDRRVRGGAAPVTPAWRPNSDRVLTYATTGGAIATVDVVSGRTLWRATAVAAAPRSLAWSRDGRRLVALLPRSVAVLGPDGRVLRSVPLPGAGRELALHPSGKKAVVAVAGGGTMRVLELRLDGRRASGRSELFQGDVYGLAWSQDGRRLLIGWRGAGQWLLLGPGGRIRPLHDVGRELGRAGGFPRVAGWCCAR